MNQRMLQTLTLLGLMLFLAACQSTTTPMSQTPTPHVTPSPIPTQTLPVLPPISTQSTSRTVPATPTQVSPPTPIPSPTAVYQNAFAVAFSADGLSLVFNSSIDGLVPEDQKYGGGAFIYHTENGSIQRVRAEKEDPLGKEIPWRATSLSANGRYLLFGAHSNSTEPAADHYNFVYLRDLKTGQDERIDFTPLEKQLSGSIIGASLSPDGRYLALDAVSGRLSIYLLERLTGKIIPVSVNPDGLFAEGDSYDSVFSPDGRYLAFVSSASNLVAGDEPCSAANLNCGDVFLFEIVTGKLDRIPARLQFTEGSPYPYLTVSNNARWLAWTEVVESSSPSLNPVVRLFDRTTGKKETVCAGAEPSCTGHSPSISTDGRWLAFSTFPATDASGQRLPDAYAQVYLLDHQTGQLTLVSADSLGTPGNGASGIISLQQEGFSSDVRISGDGRFVAFSSQAANLFPAGIEKSQCFDPIIVGAFPCYDLFVYDRQTKEVNWISRPVQLVANPIVLADLNGTSLKFLCVNDPNHCYKTIKLDSYFKFQPNSTQSNILNYVYFDSASSIFVIVGPQDYTSLLNINPSTQQIQFTDLPKGVDLRLFLYDHGKMVIGTSRGEIYIYQKDLSVKNVQLNLSENGLIGHLIDRNNDEIIALNVVPIIMDGNNYNEVFIVNINNGLVTRKLLKGPEVNKFGPGDSTLPGKKYAVTFDNVDEDLNNLYYFSLLGKSPNGGNTILSKFSLSQMADASSTNIDENIDWNTGYFQYHHILYSSRRYLEGFSPAGMFDMDKLKPLINTDVILNNSGSTRLIIAPQGNNFVLGTNDTVYVVSFTGKILKQYQIPKDWLNLDYVIMEDRN